MRPLNFPLNTAKEPPRRGTNRRLRVAIVFAILMGCGCSKDRTTSSQRQLPPASVRVQTVEVRDTPLIEEAMGTVAFKLRATVEAKVSGRIEKMLVAQGQPVRAGELLAQLDVKEIEARLEQAKATFDQAEQDLKRATALLRDQTVSQSAFEAAQARHRVARAAVVEAGIMLDYARIAAPFDGVVTRKLADVGDLAAPGKPLLEVANPGALRMEADVPESLIGRIAPGATLQMRFDNPVLLLDGVVSEIAPLAEPASRTFLVKIELPVEPRLRAGMFGRLLVPVGQNSALRVPLRALIQRGQLEIVYVVEDQAARARLVRSGKRSADEVEIISGLESGQQVVTDGNRSLVDGQPVRAER